MSKRAPIEYKPQFGGGMFRAQEIVESERAALENRPVAPVPTNEQTVEPSDEQTEASDENGVALGERTNERTNGRTVERSNERTVERTNIGSLTPVSERNTTAPAHERARVRHSFDVGQDQLHALAEIQARIFSETGRKPKLGDLVQEALDLYIKRQEKRTNERTVERSNDRETMTTASAANR